MPDAPGRPVSVLIAALGGQGGGVLTDWLVGASTHAGYPAQSTSIPGVAQRTGATTYYVEVSPERQAPGSREPVFSLYPMAGDVDVIIASELLEAGRAIEMDYASTERTTLVTSSHRLFAIGEKTAVGNGIFPRERVEEAAGKLTRRLISFDALDVARRAGSEVNAVLLGALAAARILPMAPGDFEAAIRASAVAVERNVAGFRAGMEAAERNGVGAVAEAPPAWTAVKSERAAALGRRAGAFTALADRIEVEFPAALHLTLGEAIARLIDYQGPRYAELFLERVRRVRAIDPATRLTDVFSRRLAVWMSYEDAIRVADLKTRRARFERIRRESGAAEGAIVAVTDYLKPDLDEIYGILPATIGTPIARWAERRWPDGRPSLGQHVKTTTVLGFLRVWGLGRLRFLRPRSLRYRRESSLTARWERAVIEAAQINTELGVEVAELAAAIKGYGEVRRRLSGALARVLDDVVGPVVARRDTTSQAAEEIRAARMRLLEPEQSAETLFAPAASA